MSQLIRQPRRSLDRMTVVSPYVEIEPLQIRSKANKGAAILGIAALLFIGGHFGLGLFEEESTQAKQGGSQRRRQARHRTGQRRKRSGPVPVWKRFGSGVGSKGSHADPAVVKKTFDALTIAIKLLPKIRKEKTSSTNFKQRLNTFDELLRSLPPSTRNSLYKSVTIEALIELFEKAPGKACTLLDRFFAQARIIMS